MWKVRLLTLSIFSLLAVGGSTTVAAEGNTESPADRIFVAELSGAHEVPMRDVSGYGLLRLYLTDDNTLHYVLRVDDIENVTAAHIHLGAAGANGNVVAFLYGPKPPNGGKIQGDIADGELTDSSLIADMQGKTIADLVDEIKKGNAYGNVHTSTGGPTPGPGNFPGGEIRGQLEVSEL